MKKKENKKNTETVNQSDLVKEYATMFDTTQREADVAIESTLTLLKKKLFVDKVNLSLNKFGRFYQKTTKPKKLKHPVTGEHFMTEPKEVVRFTQSNNIFNR